MIIYKQGDLSFCNMRVLCLFILYLNRACNVILHAFSIPYFTDMIVMVQ